MIDGQDRCHFGEFRLPVAEAVFKLLTVGKFPVFGDDPLPNAMTKVHELREIVSVAIFVMLFVGNQALPSPERGIDALPRGIESGAIERPLGILQFICIPSIIADGLDLGQFLGDEQGRDAGKKRS